MDSEKSPKVQQEKVPATEDLKTWLESKELGDHYNSFAQEGATKVSDLAELTDSDIEQLVNKWGLGLIKRRLVLKMFDEVRNPKHDPDAPPAYSGEPSSSSEAYLCPHHDLEFRYFCVDHDCRLCPDCFMQHNGHTMESLTDAAVRKAQEFQDFLDGPVAKVQDDRKSCIAAASTLLTRIKEAAASNKQSVEACFSQIQRALEERKAELLAQIDISSQSAELTQFLLQSSSAAESLTGLARSMRTLIEPKDLDVLEKGDELKSKIQPHLELPIVVAKPVPVVTCDTEFAARLREMGSCAISTFVQLPGIGEDLSGLELTNANLTDANLTNANLTDTNLTNANLTNANLTNANLTNANLTSANLTNASLTGANLTDATGLDLPSICLSNATRIILHNADLANANLTDAELVGFDLTNANLTNANLTNANLTNANLTNANLTNANLSGVDLTQTNLSNLTNANFADATLPSVASIWQKPGSDSDGTKQFVIETHRDGGWQVIETIDSPQTTSDQEYQLPAAKPLWNSKCRIHVTLDYKGNGRRDYEYFKEFQLFGVRF
eukprot:CAMPEP_0175161412 /NCGR_PEP_ID=MMETSP0087-20121206/24589_1 /TAXON_ID=136419 /ORGANISM="Unknown Unknown, Strain D1" /LENGTH=555 /DNA_ID=CAMNT_0016449821 /DNA_START=65 /DNA_END=1732 /DNA_ORIENTATION=+